MPYPFPIIPEPKKPVHPQEWDHEEDYEEE